MPDDEIPTPFGAAFTPGSDEAGGPVRALEVDDLHVTFETAHGRVHAVNGISFHVDSGETLGIVGESGSGKSVSAEAILGLVKSPPGKVTGGAVRFRGRDLLTATPSELRGIRGNGVSMVFQDSTTSLDPGFTIGYQIAEAIRLHRSVSWREAHREAIELLERVRIPRASDRMKQYPHQFSGGMSQRVMIAIAIALKPTVLIADEPTTALDVTVQAQVIELLSELQDEMGMALVLITHDLGLVAEVADRIAIMYAGKIVESGPTSEVLGAAAHPYTRGLLRSSPRIEDKGRALHPIQGAPPSLDSIPDGCAFNPRCDWVQNICRSEIPLLRDVAGDRLAACHFAEEVRDG